MALFTKDSSTIRSYDEQLREISSSTGVRGNIICVDNDVLFTRDGSTIRSYDKNLREIKSSTSVRGHVFN